MENQTKENNFELTLVEAICVINCDCKTKQEKELFDYANALIKKEGEKKHLEYQLFVVNQNLKKFNQSNYTEK